jgi:hypothetical protein
MAILDYREIPEAHKGSGLQDTFEQFAGEFLELLGMRLVERASRGADAGKDLAAVEVRRGKLGKSSIQYLVSCKHKAFSGKAVSPTDEQDIDDRIKRNGCDGFLGIYSTLATSNLQDKLRSLGFEYQIFDNRRIERELLRTSEGLALAKRYFPLSIRQWVTENPSPVLLFGELQLVECEICGRDLLGKIKPPGFLGGVLGYCVKADQLHDPEPTIVDLCWYCKVKCMRKMEQRLKGKSLVEDGWDDVHDYLHPTRFLSLLLSNFELVSQMNSFARHKFERFVTSAFQCVSRELTFEEKDIRERMREMGMSI